MYIEAADLKNGINLVGLECVDSTNTYAREHVRRGGAMPALIVAESQRGGRGRQGKSFYSPTGGVYLSLVIDVTGKDGRPIVALTSAAAVAVARSCEQVSGQTCGIKWVNDIYVGGKKVAGILAESFSEGGRRYVIIGVGVNLGEMTFPEDIRDIAGSLSVAATDENKRRLACRIAAELCEAQTRLDGGDLSYMEDYRARSVVLGREITFTQNGVTESGTAESIDGCGALCVRLADGERKILSSGEISLRVKE